MRTPFILVLVTCGCFNPDLSQVRICSANDAGVCPPDDLGTNAPMDLTGVSDAASVTCPNGGGVWMGTALACPGAFAAGQAQSLCPKSWVVCKTASLSTVTACGNATPAGFFVADQPAYWLGTMSQETCSSSAFNELFYGCGGAGRQGTKDCGQFTKVFDLSGSSFSSQDGDIDKLANTSASNGVLCCSS